MCCTWSPTGGPPWTRCAGSCNRAASCSSTSADRPRSRGPMVATRYSASMECSGHDPGSSIPSRWPAIWEGELGCGPGPPSTSMSRRASERISTNGRDRSWPGPGPTRPPRSPPPAGPSAPRRGPVAGPSTSRYGPVPSCSGGPSICSGDSATAELNGVGTGDPGYRLLSGEGGRQLAPGGPRHALVRLLEHLDAHVVGAGGAVGVHPGLDGVEIPPRHQAVHQPVAALVDVLLGVSQAQPVVGVVGQGAVVLDGGAADLAGPPGIGFQYDALLDGQKGIGAEGLPARRGVPRR